MILYNKSGIIVAEGVFDENSTHYIKNTTYYDKVTCNIADPILPLDFNIEDFKFVDGELEKINTHILTSYEFNLKLGDVAIDNILDNIDTDKKLRRFKYILDSSGNRIDVSEQKFIDGIGYLLTMGYISQDIYDSFFNN